ncbi:MAG TPA: hypothetical protein VEK11_22270 [Thermoanaerobaculia bacterium]|nr:hypothetical protein [Thermoanaerobaculia bacterium]
MTTTAPGELSASTVIAAIESGAYPRDIVMTIARGFLPLAQDDLITVLVYLARGEDAELVELAQTTLATDVTAKALFEFASNVELDAEHQHRLMQFTTDEMVLEALIRNRNVSDEAVAELARRAGPRVQEVIVINQARIIRAPFILDALLENPQLTPDARRRALETREEFFEKRARIAQLADDLPLEPDLVNEPLDAIADLLERAEKEPDTPPTVVLGETEKEDPKKQALWVRLYTMSVSEKVQLAFRGDRTARMILVRERNKLICSAVMRNPRMSEQEAEAIASMRNVEEEVLRLIGIRRDWMSKYNIALTLCRNPKAPVGVVLPLINRLTLRDLKGLKDDRGVSQVVREMARKAYLLRSQKN